MRLEGKVAIVTGASPNIGGAIAKGFAAEGARVVCADLDPARAAACARAITDAGGEAVAVHGDVTDPAHAAEVVAEAASRWGRVDVLVNNAVWFHERGLLTMEVEDFRRQLDIILGGSFLMTRAVARHMIDNATAGSIINVLSTAAWQGQPGNIGYCTGKSGLINFTRSAAMELAQHRIRVNGFTPTATLPEDPEVAGAALAKIAANPGPFPSDFFGQLPGTELPTPSDYVAAVIFLASDESRLMTGSNITVDAGALAKYWPWTPHSTRPEEAPGHV